MPPAGARTIGAQFSSQVGVGAAAVGGAGDDIDSRGEAGNYAATSLKPRGTWAVQQGDFNYSYPITVPPALGGARAGGGSVLRLAVDRRGDLGVEHPGGVDRRRVGLLAGFIERSYQPCPQDSAATTADAGDECWDGYNATLSLGGHSGVLVGSGPGTWHLQNDDGTSVQLLTGGAERDVERRVLAGHDHRRHEVLLRRQPPARRPGTRR